MADRQAKLDGKDERWNSEQQKLDRYFALKREYDKFVSENDGGGYQF